MAIDENTEGHTAVTVRVVSARHLPRAHLLDRAARPSAAISIRGAGPSKQFHVPSAISGSCTSPKWDGAAGETQILVSNSCLHESTSEGDQSRLRGECNGAELRSHLRGIDSLRWAEGLAGEQAEDEDVPADNEAPSFPHVTVEIFSSTTSRRSLGFATISLEAATRSYDVPQADVYSLVPRAHRCFPIRAALRAASNGSDKQHGTVFVEITVARPSFALLQDSSEPGVCLYRVQRSSCKGPRGLQGFDAEAPVPPSSAAISAHHPRLYSPRGPLQASRPMDGPFWTA